ncbi:MAG: pyridoxal-phosphate dependent enzyme, partial [Pseudorhodoplanes sp.]|nr:pyridoxal-phosphate dependent enzyme [Pseudorhodoplanes sp.]
MTSHTKSPHPPFEPDPARPFRLLRACPVYEETPLPEVRGASGRPVLVKDERGRMGLGAFKALGGVYAVAELISEAWSAAGGADLQPEGFLEPEVKEFARAMTFVCASAGNHGMAVAAGARIFGANARIHLAGSVPESFANRLTAKGAQVVRSGAVYDDAVAAALRDSEETGAILLADGSWPGYT